MGKRFMLAVAVGRNFTKFDFSLITVGNAGL
jgi:hypothetical protein